MQTLELNKMGLSPISENEMIIIEGGGIAKWVWEVVKTWGAEKLLDATYEYLKKNAPSNPYSGVPNSVRGCLPSGVRM